jgi:hypothetical protein
MHLNTTGSNGVYIKGDNYSNGITQLDFTQFKSIVFDRENIKCISAGGGSLKKTFFGFNYNKNVNVVSIDFVKPIILRHIDILITCCNLTLHHGIIIV